VEEGESVRGKPKHPFIGLYWLYSFALEKPYKQPGAFHSVLLQTSRTRPVMKRCLNELNENEKCPKILQRELSWAWPWLRPKHMFTPVRSVSWLHLTVGKCSHTKDQVTLWWKCQCISVWFWRYGSGNESMLSGLKREISLSMSCLCLSPKKVCKLANVPAWMIILYALYFTYSLTSRKEDTCLNVNRIDW